MNISQKSCTFAGGKINHYMENAENPLKSRQILNF